MPTTSDSTNPADLGVAEAAAALAARSLSARELVDACLARIDERDGTHSFDGDPDSINAWVRVYPDEARAAGRAADQRLSARRVADDGAPPPVCGIPIGLKDLYAAAGLPLTASSRVYDETPTRDSATWARLRAAGMVLVGHTHTHEFAAGGTTDQTANPWDRSRSAGGSSGGSAAALAARMVPATTGSDTAGSLRIPSALCGTATIKPTRGHLPLDGIVPLCPTLDHPGPMARSVADCALVLAAMGGFPGPGPVAPGSLEGLRLARSPRVPLVEVDPDVADGYERAIGLCEALGATVVDIEAPAPLDVQGDFFSVFAADVLPFHRRFAHRRDRYRESVRGLVEGAERAGLAAEDYVAMQVRREEVTWAWREWFAAHHIDAIVEPTIAVVAPLRGDGYSREDTDAALISLTYYWNWTGFPIVALPSGVGSRSGLPVSVSLIGTTGADAAVTGMGMRLEAELPAPVAPGFGD